MSTRNSDEFELLPGERDALEKFLRLEIGSEELRERLARVAEITVTDNERRIEPLFGLLQPGIPVGRSDIENALNKRRFGQITERELSEWAAILLLLSDAYELDTRHEGEVADWLNELSWLPAEEGD